MVIYVDILVIINFVISYFLLLASAVISGYTYKRKNLLISSGLGALFCLYIFVQTDNILMDFVVKIFSLAICVVTAFGYKNRKKLIIQTLYYILFNALLTGIIFLFSFKSSSIYHNNLFFYLNINPIMLVVVSACIYCLLLILEMVKEKVSPRQKYLMDIFFADFKITNVLAFYDSGFNVKDVISNKDVIILSLKKTESSLPSKLKYNIKNFLNEKYDDVDCRFVPVMFTTLSGSGMLPALKAEYILVENKKIENIVIAFTQDSLSENVMAIFGTDIKRQI